MSRRFYLFADFGDDNPGECGQGGSYTREAESCEEAIVKTLRSLWSLPDEIEAVDAVTHEKIRWGLEEIVRWVNAR